MLQFESKIILNEKLKGNSWHMVIETSQISLKAKPGQFIMVRITENNDPLFRRPFSIFKQFKIGQNSWGLEIVYKIVGRGTKLMSKLRSGDKLDIIGPLGHGFEWDKDKKTHILIGGGTGIVSLFMLGEEISKESKKSDINLNIFIGANNKDSVILEEEFNKLNARVRVSTDDGSYGYHGLVTDMLVDTFEKGEISTNCTIYGSGPEPMLKKLAHICKKYNIEGQVSIERHMMCGFGACLSCVCKIDPLRISKKRDLNSSYIHIVPGNNFGYALVCKDGPVFNIEEVIFDD